MRGTRPLRASGAVFSMENDMKPDTKTFSRTALCAAVAGALALGLAACDQQQKSQPLKFGKNFEIAPEKPVAGGAPQTGTAAIDIPDPGDAALATRVKSAIAAEPDLKAVTVSVNATAGVVTLNGTADNHVTSDRAARVALNVEGVRSVKNELIVVRGS